MRFIDCPIINFNKIFIFLLGSYFILTPLGAVNVPGVGSVLKLYAFLLIPFAICMKQKIYSSNILRYQFLLVLYAVLSLLYTIEIDSTIQFIVTQMMFLGLIFLIGMANFEDRDLSFIKQCLVWSSRLSVLILFFFGDTIQGRLWLSDFFNEDPNYFNGYMLFGIIFAFEQLFSKKNIKFKIFFTLEIAIYLYSSLLTGSRGGLLGMLLALLSYTIFHFFIQKNNYKTVLYFFAKILIITFLFVLFVLFLSEVSDLIILERFTLFNILNSGGTGRYEIWELAIKTFLKYDLLTMVFGNGAGTFISAINIVLSSEFAVAHNVFIQILIELGIVGVFLYAALIFSSLYYAIKIKSAYSVSILVGFIVMSMSLSIFALKPYWNAILYSNMVWVFFNKNDCLNLIRKKKRV